MRDILPCKNCIDIGTAEALSFREKRALDKGYKLRCSGPEVSNIPPPVEAMTKMLLEDDNGVVVGEVPLEYEQIKCPNGLHRGFVRMSGQVEIYGAE